MDMTTSFSSSCSCSSSYSMFTSQPPCPLSDGQQLTEANVNDQKPDRDSTGIKNLLEIGILDSSVVVYRHLSTPTSVLSGNGFPEFLRPIWARVFRSSLSILGWVCIWMPLFVGFWSWSLIRPNWSSVILKVMMPDNSIDSSPPSRLATTVIFSSNLAWTLRKEWD